ncbi:MAG: hydroxymethylglutaryl-CoA lyase [Pararhodobacter sp.]|nr:hydroxymethylglutaryl-CoA lyase [Pararhodobacter sp.]
MADTRLAYPEGRLILRDVTLRDGLQLTRSWPSTDQKRALLEALYSAGLRHFEVGSFLPADRMPQFADVRDIVDAVAVLPGAHGVALALNERGARDALATQVPEITVVLSASEAHNQANARRSKKESLAAVARITALRDAERRDTIVNAGIAMAFGCSLSGEVEEDTVLRLVEQCLEAGADMVGLADTVGYGGPRQIAQMARRMSALCGQRPWVLHLHDTRGLGLANAAAAMNEGCRVFDASLGGLGGCPFAPGASGNIVLEDLAFLAVQMGFDTDIGLEALIAARPHLSDSLPGEVMHGALAQAGLPQTGSGQRALY